MTRGRFLLFTFGLLWGSLVAPAAAQTPAPVGKFEIHADAAMPARTISFGQIFAPGAVQRADHLQVLLDGRAIPTQVDAKAFHADGSVRHAILTIDLPKLSSGKALDATVIKGDAAPVAAAGTAQIPSLDIILKIKGPDGVVKPVSLNLPVIAQNPKNAVPGFWINGPLAQERRYVTDVNDRLQVMFDVFTPHEGPARIDVIFHNDWTGIRHDDNFDYDVEMRLAGAVAFQAKGVHQYSFSTWHRLLWSDGRPSVRIVQDLGMLAAAAGVPRYVSDFSIAREFQEQISQAAAKMGDKAMEPGIVTSHMPDTGGRMDIGPLPTWAAIDLINPSEDSRKVLLANGDAAGGVPWHLRDRKTGLPLTIDAHPGLWLDSRGGDTVKGILPEAFSEEQHGWTIDDAHQPSLSYLPYLLTGSQYYRDELAAQAAYVLLYYDPEFRGQSHGLFIGEHGEAWQQVRGLSWSLRTLATAAFILPGNDPMRVYFDAKLRGNLAKLVQLYVQDRTMKSAGAVEGWVPGDYRPEGSMAPWQQNFLAVVLNWTNDMGYSDAGRVIGWMSNFLTGPFTSADQGFDPARGAAYNFHIFDPETHHRVSSWAEVFQTSGLSKLPPKEVEEAWQDYGLIARAGTAAAYSVTGSPRAKAAYEFTLARTNRIAYPIAKGDPTFAIQPRKYP